MNKYASLYKQAFIRKIADDSNGQIQLDLYGTDKKQQKVEETNNQPSFLGRLANAAKDVPIGMASYALDTPMQAYGTVGRAVDGDYSGAVASGINTVGGYSMGRMIARGTVPPLMRGLNAAKKYLGLETNPGSVSSKAKELISNTAEKSNRLGSRLLNKGVEVAKSVGRDFIGVQKPVSPIDGQATTIKLPNGKVINVDFNNIKIQDKSTPPPLPNVPIKGKAGRILQAAKSLAVPLGIMGTGMITENYSNKSMADGLTNGIDPSSYLGISEGTAGRDARQPVLASDAVNLLYDPRNNDGSVNARFGIGTPGSRVVNAINKEPGDLYNQVKDRAKGNQKIDNAYWGANRPNRQ